MSVGRELVVECSHDPCNCTVSAPATGGESFCSDYCSDAAQGGIESGFCACGHPACDEP